MSQYRYRKKISEILTEDYNIVYFRIKLRISINFHTHIRYNQDSISHTVFIALVGRYTVYNIDTFFIKKYFSIEVE